MKPYFFATLAGGEQLLIMTRHVTLVSEFNTELRQIDLSPGDHVRVRESIDEIRKLMFE